MAASVVINQQVAVPTSKVWSSGLFDCCADMNSCCYGFWCCPCFACSTTAEFGQARCLPLLDILSPAVVGVFGIPLCAPPAGLSMRVAVRNRYDIEGALCNDILASCFCVCCSWCQVAREVKHRKKAVAVVQAQPITLNIQPPAVPTAPQINVSNTMTMPQLYPGTAPQAFPMTASLPYDMAPAPDLYPLPPPPPYEKKDQFSLK